MSEYVLAIHNLDREHCFWDFIDGTLNATCQPMINQEKFYSGYKQKHRYKYQSNVTLDGLVSSLMGLFISWRGDCKMIEMPSLEARLREVNQGKHPAMA